LTLIAAGGIESEADAWERLCAGASLVQIYTALIYEGPALPRRLALGLLARARAEGFATLAEAVQHHHSKHPAAAHRDGLSSESGEGSSP
jgi:dihydroorotate dehydrogenase